MPDVLIEFARTSYSNSIPTLWCRLLRSYLRRVFIPYIRTCHASRHKGGEHEKEHPEEQTAGVVVDLGGLVADVHVQQTNEDADRQVRY